MLEDDEEDSLVCNDFTEKSGIDLQDEMEEHIAGSGTDQDGETDENKYKSDPGANFSF